jgi:hypothetical protein
MPKPFNTLRKKMSLPAQKAAVAKKKAELEKIRAEDEIEIKESEEILAHGEFEDWSAAKKEILIHLRLDEDDLFNKSPV